MNRENMHKVADFVEKENAFQMRTWIVEHNFDIIGTVGHNTAEGIVHTDDMCGTVACLGGTANILRAREMKWSLMPGEAHGILHCDRGAAAWLGVTVAQSHQMFYKPDLDGGTHEIDNKRELVPDALRYMADTGDTSWRNALAKAQERKDCKERTK